MMQKLIISDQNYQMLKQLIPDFRKLFHYRRLRSDEGPEVHLRCLESNSHYRIYTMGQYVLRDAELLTVNEFTFLLDHESKSVRLIGFNDRNFWYHVFKDGGTRDMAKDLEIYFNTWLRTLKLKNYTQVQLK